MFDPRTMIAFNIRDVSQQIFNYIHNEGESHDTNPFKDNHASDRISRLQGMAVGFIHSHKDRVIQKDLEKTMHISKSTASGLVHRMVKNGLLYTTPATDDARVKCLHLTNYAEDIMQEIDKSANATEAKLRQGISEEDLETFFKVLKQIKMNAQ
ncbi:MarR family winged helix-turn-helix transcriptional regulator [Companilactobacillus huachuanensis]|uniref:MarR family winged helix-turn-helix transcriptional regulator n=1 Tax=Companilactobacillus huachuanensis TaxID=2559914 RepID=A0ABW1RPX3_9LACO|nr:MarR family winged helix-turn-helix transcriptional regulator [Companilactobacillus huachuanensis]